MQTTTGNRPGLRRWTLAATACALLAACGGESGTPISSGAPASKLLTATEVSSSIPLSYSVRNLPDGFTISRPQTSVNDKGQVCGFIFNRYTNAVRAVLYEDGELRNLSDPNDRNSWVPQVINASGWVAGNIISSDGNKAFLYDGVTTRDLTEFVGTFANVIAINDAGQVSGYRELSDNSIDTFLYDKGSVRFPVTLSGTRNVFARAMNNAGQITGYYIDQDNFTKGYLYSGSATTTIFGPAPIQVVTPSAINDLGQVTGDFSDGAVVHAFRYKDGHLVDLGALENATNTSNAVSINAKGEVAGNTTTPSGQQFAFMHDGSSMRAIGTLGGSRSSATSMNDGSVVVGSSTTPAGTSRAFVWSAAEGRIIDLNDRIPKDLGIELTSAGKITNSGIILALSNTGLVLLYPDARPNSPPTVGSISASDPAAIGAAVSVSAPFTDTDVADTHTASWTWGDGSTTSGNVTEPSASAAGSIAASHVYTTSGVYNISVTVTVTDSAGKSSSVGGQVVVYDPNGGFVAGGGWINSPIGAYKADPTLGGRATFGFTSKYLKGATKPSGQTEFQFQSANLNFHSSDYDWLVVGGARAQYKGTGTINGSGSYKFMLTAVDGDLIGKGTPDRFRMRIWHYDEASKTDVVDYDNQIDSSTEGGNLEGTAIGGGSISIKTK